MVWISLSLFFLSSFASAEAPTPAGLKLIKAIESHQTYSLKVSNSACPSVMRFEEAHLSSSGVLSGDMKVKLAGYEALNDSFVPDEFKFLNGNFIYRPSLRENVRAKIAGDCRFFLGVGCYHNYQEEKEGIIRFEGKANVVSILYIIFNTAQIEFNSHDGSLTYIFEGTGVNRVTCKYAPSENLEKLRMKLSPRTDHSDRSEFAPKKRAWPTRKSLLPHPSATGQ